MSKELVHCEALILKKVLFRDYDEILTAFSREWGLIKTCVHGGRSKAKGCGSLTAPLQVVEMQVWKHGGEIWTCQEIHVVDSLRLLRSSYSVMAAAGLIVQSLLASHDLHWAAPDLYKTLLMHLKLLPESACALTCATSFRIKMLLAEGVFHAHDFSPEARPHVQFLAENRSLDILRGYKIPPTLHSTLFVA